ncbi:MAG: hypothetical protein NTW52_02700 [Planctomycetota bacterium]|nr:hypothetical protein [Planctomycetota bacterium]
MFGIGKSSPKKSAKEPFNAKQFLLDHCEKMILALFVGASGWLVYQGFSGNSFESATKTPESLKEQSVGARNKIVGENHWTNLVQSEPGRLVTARFATKSETSRKPTTAEPYSIGRLDNKDLQKGGKRGDPEIVSPFDIEVKSFFGVIAVSNLRPAPADDLPNAPPVSEDRRRGRAKPAAVSTVERKLDPKYDKGYSPLGPNAELSKNRKPKPKEWKVIPKVVGFNAVTAVVDHQQLLSNYKREFELAAGYMPNRDSPNYVGFQVQRADVTDSPFQDPAEDQWKDAPECSTAGQLKMLDYWAGEAKEIAVENYLEKDILAMPIPPVLLADYAPLASHELIPKVKVFQVFMGSGEGGTEGSMMEEKSTEGSNYESSMEGEGSGGFRVAPLMTPEETAMVAAATPKIPVYSTHKLIRFFDFGVQLNRIYRYRIRLVVEDPNFPRLESLKVNTASMKPETVARVQQLEEANRAEVQKLAPGKKLLVRNSKLVSPWSDASALTSLRPPTELFASGVDVTVTGVKAKLVYGEWDTKMGLMVPKGVIAERGMVLSGPPVEGGSDVIHPVMKIIKQFTGFGYRNPVTIADLRGGQALAAQNRPEKHDKDPLPSAGEVVAYDPRTGDLVISGEFADLEDYRMYSFADEMEAMEKATKPSKAPAMPGMNSDK